MKTFSPAAKLLALVGVGLGVAAIVAVSAAPDGGRPISYTDPVRIESASASTADTPARPRMDRFSFTDADGRPLTVDDFKGKVLLVNLWATWCPPCISEMPAMNRLQATLGGDRFQVVAVSLDRGGVAVSGRWLSANRLDALGRFNASPSGFKDLLLPTSYLVDARGRIAWQGSGAKPWDSPPLVEVIRRLMAE